MIIGAAFLNLKARPIIDISRSLTKRAMILLKSCCERFDCRNLHNVDDHKSPSLDCRLVDRVFFNQLIESFYIRRDDGNHYEKESVTL